MELCAMLSDACCSAAGLLRRASALVLDLILVNDFESHDRVEHFLDLAHYSVRLVKLSALRLCHWVAATFLEGQIGAFGQHSFRPQIVSHHLGRLD